MNDISLRFLLILSCKFIEIKLFQLKRVLQTLVIITKLDILSIVLQY